MGDGYEENKKNPTISKVEKRNCPNYFIIKYKSEEERLKFSEILIKIINKYELKDFHIEEKKAFIEAKIFYNFHTLKTGNNFSNEELEKEFLKYFKN